MANVNAIFKAKKAASLTNPTSASTFVQSDDSTKAAVVYFPVLDSNAKSAMFKVRALGRATTAGSYNVTPKIDFGSSATAASNTVIMAATARACATTTTAWLIEGYLYWDSTSQNLKGVFMAMNGSTATLDTWAAATTKTGVDLTAAGNALSVELTIATGGTGYLDELSLEVM